MVARFLALNTYSDPEFHRLDLLATTTEDQLLEDIDAALLCYRALYYSISKQGDIKQNGKISEKDNPRDQARFKKNSSFENYLISNRSLIEACAFYCEKIGGVYIDPVELTKKKYEKSHVKNLDFLIGLSFLNGALREALRKNFTVGNLFREHALIFACNAMGVSDPRKMPIEHRENFREHIGSKAKAIKLAETLGFPVFMDREADLYIKAVQIWNKLRREYKAQANARESTPFAAMADHLLRSSYPYGSLLDEAKAIQPNLIEHCEKLGHVIPHHDTIHAWLNAEEESVRATDAWLKGWRELVNSKPVSGKPS